MSTCLVTVAAFTTPAGAAEMLLGVLMVLMLALGFCLWRGRTGTAAHASSAAAVCVLMQIPETKKSLTGLRIDPAEKGKEKLEKQLARRLKDTELKLGWVMTGARADDYGLIVMHKGTSAVPKQPLVSARNNIRPPTITFRVGAAERILQGSFLFFPCGVLATLFYYGNVKYTNLTESAFEYFMDSQEFGVIMLFTGIGELVCVVWDHFFSSMFLYTTHKGSSILMSTNNMAIQTTPRKSSSSAWLRSPSQLPDPFSSPAQ